jgi:sulfur carrier protein
MNQASTMEIRLNGERHALSGHVTVAELLAAHGHAGKRVAVERNGEIVPRSRHDSTVLQPDDRIEIVVAVGGG